MSSFFNTDETKEEYNASEPVNDRQRWLDQFVHLMGHTGHYTRDEAIAAIDADGLLPDMLTFDPARPAQYPNGRVFTDDVIDTGWRSCPRARSRPPASSRTPTCSGSSRTWAAPPSAGSPSVIRDLLSTYVDREGARPWPRRLEGWSGTMSKAERTRTRNARQKIAAQQAAARRAETRRRLLIAGGSVAVVVALVATLVAVKLTSATPAPPAASRPRRPASSARSRPSRPRCSRGPAPGRRSPRWSRSGRPARC